MSSPFRAFSFCVALGLTGVALLGSAGRIGAEETPVSYRVSGDGIPDALAAGGDAERGRRIAADRNRGACVLCHAIPQTLARFMGDLGPSLAGVGSRYTAAQLRLRIVDSTRVHPDAAMPAYYRVDELHHVASPYRDRTILTAQQIEDVVAYLQTLR